MPMNRRAVKRPMLPPYIMIFEDDITLADGLTALADIEKKPTGKDNWIYLPLFYTETSLGRSSSDFAYRNTPMIFVLAI